ncbi:MAG: hypothetical protein A2Y91_06250 [Chloroflexi bacterium RBG_13_54_8]|nr:MAG: hypothetical protein A2Y91_06250 [Chloroflexi bacterium RBG_13_54_8]
MIYWSPLLHFYQPPTQTHWILDKVCDESYRPLIEIFRHNAWSKVTVNICAALTDLLVHHGKSDIIKGLTELAERGQIEFAGSAKYHPILPLIPRDEVMRQITHNYETNRRVFGPVYAPKGFFPPEMAYSRDIASPVLETGHEWIILSGVACPTDWPMDIIHEVVMPGGKLAVFFRDDILSNMISFRQIDAFGFLKHLGSLRQAQQDIYVITAMDAETFGHHIKSWEKLFLEEVYMALEALPVDPVERGVRQLRTLVERQKKALSLHAGAEGIRVVTISELLNLFRRGRSIEPGPSSWSTMGDDLKALNYYPLWNNPDNQVHQLLWEHMHITIEMVKKSVELSDNEASRLHAEIARGLLDLAFQSDQFWWASRRPNWDINLINQGLIQQYEALLNGCKALLACDSLSPQEKREYRYREIVARDIIARIRDQFFR